MSQSLLEVISNRPKPLGRPRLAVYWAVREFHDQIADCVINQGFYIKTLMRKFKLNRPVVVGALEEISKHEALIAECKATGDWAKFDAEFFKEWPDFRNADFYKAIQTGGYENYLKEVKPRYSGPKIKGEERRRKWSRPKQKTDKTGQGSERGNAPLPEPETSQVGEAGDQNTGNMVTADVPKTAGEARPEKTNSGQEMRPNVPPTGASVRSNVVTSPFSKTQTLPPTTQTRAS